MKTYEHTEDGTASARAHPWADAEGNASHRYYDLKANPELIRSALEDFVPWSRFRAVETFYSLLAWLNGPDALLESNDCAFEGPEAADSPATGRSLECSGRLMVLYRELPLNLSLVRVQGLKNALHGSCEEFDRDFDSGAIGSTIVWSQYVTLPLPEARQRGYQLMLSFWAWGDTEGETMANLDRLFQNLSGALRKASLYVP